MGTSPNKDKLHDLGMMCAKLRSTFPMHMEVKTLVLSSPGLALGLPGYYLDANGHLDKPHDPHKTCAEPILTIPMQVHTKIEVVTPLGPALAFQELQGVILGNKG